MSSPDWTVDAIKQYLDSHLDGIHQEIVTRVTELHREHDKFEQTVKDGFVKQNEFRGSLEDLGRTMATRRELETLDQAMGDRLSKAERWQAKIGGGFLIVSLLVGFVFPSVMAILVYFITHHHH